MFLSLNKECGNSNAESVPQRRATNRLKGRRSVRIVKQPACHFDETRQIKNRVIKCFSTAGNRMC